MSEENQDEKKTEIIERKTFDGPRDKVTTEKKVEVTETEEEKE